MQWIFAWIPRLLRALGLIEPSLEPRVVVLEREVAEIKIKLGSHVVAFSHWLNQVQADIAFLQREQMARQFDKKEMEIHFTYLTRSLDAIVAERDVQVRIVEEDQTIPADLKQEIKRQLAAVGPKVRGKRQSLDAVMNKAG